MDNNKCIDVQELMDIDGEVTMYHLETGELRVHEQQLKQDTPYFSNHVLCFHFAANADNGTAPSAVRRMTLRAFFDHECPALLREGFVIVDPMAPTAAGGRAHMRLLKPSKLQLKLQLRFRGAVDQQYDEEDDDA